MSRIYDQPNTTLATVTRPTTISATTPSTTIRQRGQKLTKEQKFYIAELLGCYLTPSQVAREFEEHFGMAISPQAVQCYDPTKRAGAQTIAGRVAIIASNKRRGQERRARKRQAQEQCAP